MGKQRAGAAENADKTWRDQLSALRNIPPFLRLIWRASPRLTVANIALRLLEASLPAAILYVGKLIVDEVLLLLDGAGDTTVLWQLVALEFGLALVSDLLSRGISLVDGLLSDLISNSTSVELMRHAATLDLYQFENPEFYDKLERARQQTTGRSLLMSQILAQFQSIVTLLVLGGSVIAFNPWLILLLVFAVIPGFIQENYFNQQKYSLTRSWTPERRELDYLRYLGASDTTAKEVKIFGLADFITDRFAALSMKYFYLNRDLSIRRAGWGALFSGIGSVSYYGAYVLILLQTIDGLITVGTLTFLAGAFRRMQQSLQTILLRAATIGENALYLQDLFDFFEITPSIVDGPNALPFPSPVREGWVFEGVSFQYPGAETFAIEDLSFTLPAGTKLALVGENGAGKTTLVKLLARLYEPSAGRILLDGHDLREYRLADLRDNVGVIFQDFFRYQLSARENIAVGRINDLGVAERIEDSARKSLAAEVIAGLPGGYDQLLGRRFAGALDLSGGQWQKVALARAYMRDAQLLILDEPTAALDARAEYEVFQRFTELIAGKSAVIISHRFSTVRMADLILFLEYGRRLEMGSHEALMALDGRYAELFKLQAKGYQ
ncbi:ABC transporter ATP-binding protein [Neolewinella lacunae]|uniref:ABC transporter ATP-binding protein n=1 Tax=Neolewinella lacunae TaxID=1517758 RepID=A0A923TA47_9BACT|nr:ABC transporter ATP-binding protein [Neolewinella lacunae]MBC6996189.1 ABC transporter ATP-binding protein [Neolewinella lacunae]MDN3635363.1 ABC transporter ATP-binding protein [Neolewinella lacunae]